MQNTQSLKKAFCFNLITFALILFSVMWMFSGLSFGNAPVALTAARLGMFRYYTVDSNVIMGLIALLTAIIQMQVMNNKLEKVPTWIPAVKLLGVVGVTLTMLVTIFFLAPTMGPFAVFSNSNLFLHVINPIISIYVFLFLEKTDELTLKHSFFGITSMLIYAVYYVTTAVIHSHGNVVDKGYDWYGFLVLGLSSAFIIVPLLILITYGISFALWKTEKLIYKKSLNK